MPLASCVRRIPPRLISFFLCFLNVMLIMLTLGSHGWTIYFPDTDVYSAGLWVICSKKYGSQFIKSSDVYLNTIRISMKTALVTATIAMLWTVEWDYIFHCKFTFLPKPLVTAIFNFIPGFSLLLATSVFEFQFNQEFVKPARKWALYLTYVICILCFLSGVYNLVCYKYSLWEGTVYSGKISSSKTQQEDEQPQTSLG